MIVISTKNGMTVAPYLYQEGDIFIYTGLYADELEKLEGKDFDEKQREIFGEILLRKPTASELYRGLKKKLFDIGDCSKEEKKKLIPYLRDKKKADMQMDESLMRQAEPEIEEFEEEEETPTKKASSKKTTKKTSKKGASRSKKK